MKITRKSYYSGIVRTRDLDITEEQIEAYQNGALIQNAFPDLSDTDREFLLTGITTSEWIEMFSEKND
jgi:hypothetical protein